LIVRDSDEARTAYLRQQTEGRNGMTSKGLTYSSSSSDSSDGRATSSSSSSASCFLLRVDIVLCGMDNRVQSKCCCELKLGRRVSCESRAWERGPDELRTFRRMAGKPGKGTKLCAIIGIWCPANSLERSWHPQAAVERAERRSRVPALFASRAAGTTSTDRQICGHASQPSCFGYTAHKTLRRIP